MKKLILILLLTTLSYSKITPYFSKISGGYYRGGVDNIIIDDILNAKSSIKIAIYYLTNKNITSSLIQAYKKGVNIEIYTDDKKINSKRYKLLIAQGINIHCDKNPKALMHNKFLIIDKKILWVGSGNYTVYSFYRNYDNFLKIDDIEVVEYYNKKFDLLYNHSTNSLKPYKSSKVEVYFSPKANFEERLISLINSATSSINFLAFAFTNSKISKALINAKGRGVEIKGVFDKAQNRYQKYSQYKILKANNISVKLDKNRFKLHSKVFIIDKKIVVSGSYNFTKKANNQNDENSIIIKDRDIADIYLKRFYKIFR